MREDFKMCCWLVQEWVKRRLPCSCISCSGWNDSGEVVLLFLASVLIKQLVKVKSLCLKPSFLFLKVAKMITSSSSSSWQFFGLILHFRLFAFSYSQQQHRFAPVQKPFWSSVKAENSNALTFYFVILSFSLACACLFVFSPCMHENIQCKQSSEPIRFQNKQRKALVDSFWCLQHFVLSVHTHRHRCYFWN